MPRLILVLHAHLPWVRHPEHPDALEEDWLYEAITETYLPLLALGRRWMQDNLQSRVTLSVSPPLLQMWADPLLMMRYRARLERLIALAEAEQQTGDPERAPLAAYYAELWRGLSTLERSLEGGLIGGLVELDRAGVIELCTSAATHAFLPFFSGSPGYVAGQIELGARTFERHVGRRPRGLWLPECGYSPGIDRALAAAGIEWTFLDTHGVERADPRPLYGVGLPIVSPAGVSFFGRDPESARQVWSADEGYPGDGRYREFHRDAGWDLPAERLQGLILPDGTRRLVGLKYHRITDRTLPLGEKALYQPALTQEVVRAQAQHFVAARIAAGQGFEAEHGRPSAPAALYDAELFGHWWFEGPTWLDQVVRLSQGNLQIVSPSQVLAGSEAFQVATPAQSSWGDRGYGAVWLNEKNAWIWPPLHDAVAQLSALLDAGAPRDPLERRALAQLTRELCLASASDWPFILTTGTMVPYAERRVRLHLGRFQELRQALMSGRLGESALAALEQDDPIFPDLDPRIFRSPS